MKSDHSSSEGDRYADMPFTHPSRLSIGSNDPDPSWRNKYVIYLRRDKRSTEQYRDQFSYWGNH